MSNVIELVAKKRDGKGTGASRQLRHAELVPGVVYGGSQEPESLTFEHNKIMHATENPDFYSTVLQLAIEGKKEPVIVKAIQRHPSERRLLHIDLQRVSDKEAVVVHVPLVIVGQDKSRGIRQGGNPQQYIKIIKIKALPKDLPESLQADVSELGMGHSLYLSELTLPKGVQLTVDVKDKNQNVPVFRVIPPRGVKAEK